MKYIVRASGTAGHVLCHKSVLFCLQECMRGDDLLKAAQPHSANPCCTGNQPVQHPLPWLPPMGRCAASKHRTATDPTVLGKEEGMYGEYFERK